MPEVLWTMDRYTFLPVVQDMNGAGYGKFIILPGPIIVFGGPYYRGHANILSAYARFQGWDSSHVYQLEEEKAVSGGKWDITSNKLLLHDKSHDFGRFDPEVIQKASDAIKALFKVEDIVIK